jgi:hypothetical protein
MTKVILILELCAMLACGITLLLSATGGSLGWGGMALTAIGLGSALDFRRRLTAVDR